MGFDTCNPQKKGGKPKNEPYAFDSPKKGSLQDFGGAPVACCWPYSNWTSDQLPPRWEWINWTPRMEASLENTSNFPLSEMFFFFKWTRHSGIGLLPSNKPQPGLICLIILLFLVPPLASVRFPQWKIFIEGKITDHMEIGLNSIPQSLDGDVILQAEFPPFCEPWFRSV